MEKDTVRYTYQKSTTALVTDCNKHSKRVGCGQSMVISRH